MKFYFLFFVLLFQTCLYAQESVSLNIEFTVDHDSFPNCRTVYVVNGQYNIVKQKLPFVDIPNTVAVNPVELNSNGEFIFHSFSLQANEFESIELDEYQITPYSREEVRQLVLASPDSLLCDWKMSDNVYLWENFNITFDAQPATTRIISKTDSIASPMEWMTVTSGIIDGVFIIEQYVRIETLKHKHLPNSFIPKYSNSQNRVSQTKLDSLLKPFYFSNYEVTNGEYREFINWVIDSIELRMAYENLPHSDAILLLNCSKKERVILDSTLKQDNLARYGLNRNRQKKIDKMSWSKSIQELYHPQPKRFYRRPQINVRKLVYETLLGQSIPVYPDTNGFRIADLDSYGDSLSNLSWHPAFENHPVVNLNSEQMMAYCQWKERQMNEEFKLEGYRIRVHLPSISEYEFATKATLDETGYSRVFDRPNSFFITNKRSLQPIDHLFYHSVYYNPFEKLRKGNQNRQTPSILYKLWYQANQTESTVKFLNGNVSEIVIDEVTAEKLVHYEIKSSSPNSPANFVLGSNYLTGVKTFGDDQFNAIFYKTVLEKGTSSPLVGFRLVYTIEEE